MELIPILVALRRNRLGAILITVQIAVTLAVLCNGAFIIRQHMKLIDRPTGADEATLFVMSNEWIGPPKSLAAKVRTDLSALRALPGVVDAYATNTYPLSESGSTWPIFLRAEYHHPAALTAVYFGDDHAVGTLGLRLIAGRNFKATEVSTVPAGGLPKPSALIVTRDLARRLFHGGDAVGREIYLDGAKAGIPIVGVVARLQVPWTSAGGWGSTFSGDSMLLPVQPASGESVYVVRAARGRLAFVIHAAQQELYAVDPSRILSGVRTLSDARRAAYQNDRGFVVVLAIVCLLIIAVTAFGIVGLTSYWVAQRRRQIGIRRALGATRPAILRYFQTENFMIAAAGGVVGILLCLAANLWTVESFQMPRMPWDYPLVGLAVVLALGQLAAFWPALRAASVPPAVATRSV